MKPECTVCGSTSCGWYYPTERAAEKNEVIRCPKCNPARIELAPRGRESRAS